jgi:hypothetical protein
MERLLLIYDCFVNPICNHSFLKNRKYWQESEYSAEILAETEKAT